MSKNLYPVEQVELKPCPWCGTKMNLHSHCFSHPRPQNGDCILRHYSFDNTKADAWNTRIEANRSSGPDVERAGIIARLEYILDEKASATERMHRRAHLTNHDIRQCIAAIASIGSEREAIVGWLRANSQDDGHETMILRWAADAIARGGHVVKHP